MLEFSDIFRLVEMNTFSPFRTKIKPTVCLFSAEGSLPLQLNCSFPGKWFTVENVAEKDINGRWKEVAAARKIANKRCKASRIVKPGAGFQCTVDVITGISAADEVKVEFYCWEIGEINHWCFQESKDLYKFRV